MKKPSTTTLIILAGLLIIGSIYFLYLHDETTTQFQSCGSSEPTLNIFDTLSATTCTPSAGYDICYQYGYGAALAQIQSTNWQGKQGLGFIDGANRNYYIDEVYVNVKYRGDRLYKSSSSSWISCGSSGCSATSVSDGKHVLATAPASYIPNIQFTAWDKFTSTSGQWWWASKSFGWISGPYQYYVIDCYDNSDVPEGYFCDKSGTWDTWSAKQDKCIGVDVPNICVKYNLHSQTCDKVTGELTKDILIKSNSIECGCYYPNEIPNICIDYDLYSQVQKMKCVNSGFRPYQLLEINSVECGYVCQAGDTQLITCTDESTVTKTICENNKWITTTEYPEQLCPINWNNIDMILTSYIDQITTIVKGLFS